MNKLYGNGDKTHTTDLCLHAVNKLVNEGQSDPNTVTECQRLAGIVVVNNLLQVSIL